MLSWCAANQLAALNQSNNLCAGMVIGASWRKTKTRSSRAPGLLDPLTASILTIEETRKMVDEIFCGGKDNMQGYK